MEKQDKQFIDELEKLHNQNLITKSQLEEITKSYSTDERKQANIVKRNRLAQVFLTLAVVMIVVAALLFTVISGVKLSVKLITTATLTFFLYIAGSITFRKNIGKAASLTTLCAASLLLFLVLILFTSHFDIWTKLDFWMVMLIVFTITSSAYLITSFATNNGLFMLIFGTSFLGLSFSILKQFSLLIVEGMITAGLILLVFAYLNSVRIKLGVAFLYFFGAISILGLTFFASLSPSEYFWQTLFAYEILLFIFGSAFLKSKTLFAVGVGFAPVFLLTIYFLYFSNYLSPIVGLLVLGVIFLSAGLFVERNKLFFKKIWRTQ